MAAYKIPMAGSGMKRDRQVFNAALAKWFNITDAATQNGMFAYVNKFENKPYPHRKNSTIRA